MLVSTTLAHFGASNRCCRGLPCPHFAPFFAACSTKYVRVWMDGLLLPWANTSRRQVKPDAGPVQIWGPVVDSPTFGTEQRPESARIPEEGDSECSLIYGQCVSQDQRTLGTYSKCFLNIQREMLPSPQIRLHSVCEIAQFITPQARHKRIKASGDTRKAYQPRCNLCSASSRVASSDALSISRSRSEDLRHPVPDIFNAVFFQPLRAFSIKQLLISRYSARLMAPCL
jgi:hypothetical protein